MDQYFREDPGVQQVAEAYALDAVDLAKDHFRVDLDGSENSIQEVERILDRLSTSIPIDKPDENTIWIFAKAFGSYVGEVMRKHHGGTWGMMQLEEGPFPAIQLTGGACCWPWGKALNRLLNGDEDNVWHYYLATTEKTEPR